MTWICGKHGKTFADGKPCKQCRMIGSGGVQGPPHAHANGKSLDFSTCSECVLP